MEGALDVSDPAEFVAGLRLNSAIGCLARNVLAMISRADQQARERARGGGPDVGEVGYECNRGTHRFYVR